jgi:hypothetical protein
MKKYLFILLLAACNKSQPIVNQWQALKYHDTETINHAFACSSSDYIGIDTIKVITGPLDSNKFYLEPGSIYQDPKNVDGNRTYWKLLNQLQ